MHCVPDARKGELCCISDAREGENIVSMMQEEVKTLYFRCKRDGFFVYENQERLNFVGISIIKTKIDVRKIKYCLRPWYIRTKKDENVVYAYQKQEI